MKQLQTILKSLSSALCVYIHIDTQSAGGKTMQNTNNNSGNYLLAQEKMGARPETVI